ncbi:hypothetical protein SpCBS45565_g05397 [Spizellomyces sp. 'palustris']|nr:hypothetical protein SpCBS45565_g05397 [Spizellomyces sp. 'palustris']
MTAAMNLITNGLLPWRPCRRESNWMPLRPTDPPLIKLSTPHHSDFIVMNPVPTPKYEITNKKRTFDEAFEDDDMIDTPTRHAKAVQLETPSRNPLAQHIERMGYIQDLSWDLRFAPLPTLTTSIITL